MKVNLGGPTLEFTIGDGINIYLLLEIADLKKRIETLESQYPALQKGVARDPKPDEMNLQQGRKSPTRKPLAADHPASSHKKNYCEME